MIFCGFSRHCDEKHPMAVSYLRPCLLWHWLGQFQRHVTWHGTADCTAFGKFHGNGMGFCGVAVPWYFVGLHALPLWHFQVYDQAIVQRTAMGHMDSPMTVRLHY